MILGADYYQKSREPEASSFFPNRRRKGNGAANTSGHGLACLLGFKRWRQRDPHNSPILRAPVSVKTPSFSTFVTEVSQMGTHRCIVSSSREYLVFHNSLFPLARLKEQLNARTD
jgi:hypothetical protein